MTMLIDERYELVAMVQRGRSTTRYKAIDHGDPGGGSAVTLTVLAQASGVGPRRLERLRERVRELEQLAHPDIPTYYRLGITQDAVFAVSEHVDGEPLANIVEQLAPEALEAEEIDMILQTVGNALAAGQDRGITHGDPGLGDVLITPDYRIRLTGFERAAAAGAMPLDPSADVIALARMAFELHLGEAPAGRIHLVQLDPLPRQQAQAILAVLNGRARPAIRAFLLQLGLEPSRPQRLPPRLGVPRSGPPLAARCSPSPHSC